MSPRLVEALVRLAIADRRADNAEQAYELARMRRETTQALALARIETASELRRAVRAVVGAAAEEHGDAFAFPLVRPCE